MVVCVIALVVFGFLGIFSAKYRRLAKEAFSCVFKMVQLKPCDTGFNQRVKAYVTTKLMKFPPFAKFVYNNFNLLSWVFVLTFFLSIGGIAYGIYNYVAFGNCNGPNSTGFCIYNAINKATMSPKDIVIGDHPVRGNPNVNVTIIEFACLQCPYSKDAEPIVEQVLNSYAGKVNLAFFFFPLPQHLHGKLAATADYCAGQQGKFWEYHDLLFQNQNQFNNNVTDAQALNTITNAAQQLNLDINQFNLCLNSDYAKQKVQADIDLGNKLGITGTPTFFIGNDKLIGPQPFSEFQNLVEKQIQ
jgi:protein-disulfide isomerase